MMKVLVRFAPYHSLMRKHGRIYYKTGTLKDVKTCVGYISAGNLDLYPFVILFNRPFFQLNEIITCLGSLVPGTT